MVKIEELKHKEFYSHERAKFLGDITKKVFSHSECSIFHNLGSISVSNLDYSLNVSLYVNQIFVHNAKDFDKVVKLAEEYEKYDGHEFSIKKYLGF